MASSLYVVLLLNLTSTCRSTPGAKTSSSYQEDAS